MDEPLTATATAADQVGRARMAAARFRAVLRVEGVLAALLPGEPSLMRLFRSQAAVDGRFTLLTGLAPDSAEFEALLKSLERVMRVRERALLGLDEAVSRDHFEECFRGPAFERAALADYVSLLCHANKLDLPICDRICTLVSAVVGEGGPLAGAQARQVLMEVLPPTALPTAAVESAVAWFQAASLRATEASSLEALIESEFFLEVRSHQVSLGPAILDPEVMAASLEFDATLAATIDRQAESDPAEVAALRRHLALAESDVRTRLDAQEAPEALAQRRYQPRAPPPPTRRTPAEGTQFAPQAGRWPGWLTYKRAAAGVLMVAVAVLLLQMVGGASTTSLDASERGAFTPLLTEAGLAPADRPQTLFGRFDGEIWKRSSEKERGLVARELAVRVTARGLTSATVLVGESVVVQIEHGRVLMVQ